MLNNRFFLLAAALLAVSSSAWVVRLLPETSAITLAFWRMLLASAMVFLFSYKTFPVAGEQELDMKRGFFV